MEISLKLFSRQGYQGTTIRDIATAAHVTPSNVMYHYKTKENLYKSVLERYAGGSMDMVLSMLEMDKPLQGLEELKTRLYLFLQALIRFRNENPDIENILETEILQGLPYAKEEFKNLISQLIEKLGAFLQQAIRSGILSSRYRGKDLAVHFLSLFTEPRRMRVFLHEFGLMDLSNEKILTKLHESAFELFFQGVLPGERK